MKILCICYEYPPIGGGGGPVCQGICEVIVAAGHHVDVVTSGMRDLPRHETRNGVDIHRHGCVRRHRHYTTTLELITGLMPAYRCAMALARCSNYDLIHCHFAVPSGIVARQVARRTNLPYMITAHGSDVPGYNPDRFGVMHKLIQPIWRRVLKDANAISTPSRFLMDLIQSQIDVPVHVIPNGFCPPPSPGVVRHNRVLVVTRMFERKGVQHVIEAMRDMDTAWQLHVVGDGPYLPALRRQAEQVGFDVQFHGYVQGQALVDLYHSAKVFVFPSSVENFPVVLLEAMAAGCAVVTTANTGCAEVVDSAAICVERENPQAIRAALERLLHDESLLQHYSDQAVQRVGRFNWANIGAEFEAFYRQHARSAAIEPAGAAAS